MRTSSRLRTLAIVSVIALTAPLPAAVRYVDASASGANNGSSWTHAFTDLQSALAAAVPGDEIWVAATYTPAPPGDAVSSFVLREGVALYGGFAGGETARNQRDWSAHATVLSGDVGRDDTFDPQGSWPYNYHINTANSGHVVVGSGVGASAVLDGFTITAGAYGPPGTPAGDPLLYGSGLYVANGSPTVANCTFVNNLAAFGPGAAVFLADSNASITDCVFDQNYIHLGSGGAIYLYGASQPVISNCAFRRNVVTGYYGAEGQGGAIENRSSLPLTIAGCLFEFNEARPFGASSYEIPRGGGISSFAFETPLLVRDCIFRSNRAPYGAGLFTWNPTTIVNCTFDHNTAFVYPGYGGFSVGGDGAGLACQWTDVTLVNSAVAYNTGQEAAGVFEISDPNFPLFAGSLAVQNTIIWGNVANGQDVSPLDRQLKGNYSARYSCIQDLLTPVPGEDPPDPANYPGCIVVDPQFVNSSDLHLAAGSPCIDAGRNSYVPAGTTTDLDGLPRFYDDPAAPNVGHGTPPLVDMGAYERQPAPCPGDLDGNGQVDLGDLSTLLSHFGTGSGATAADGDSDGDGDVDLADLAALLAAFGTICA